MVPKFDDLKDRTKYKKILKNELTTMTASAVPWVLFDKFKFNDKVAPLLLVGDMANKVPFEAAKETNAPIKAKGKCVKQGDAVAFVEDMGTLALDKIEADLGGVACKVAKSLKAGPETAPTDEQLKGAAENKYALSQKQFDAIKARISDQDRAKMREVFGKAVDAMEAKKYGEAITALKAMELLMAKAGNELRQDARAKEEQADSLGEGLVNKIKLATKLGKEVTDLKAEILKQTNAKTLYESRSSKSAASNVTKLTQSLKLLNESLPDLEKQLETASKDRNADQKLLRELTNQIESTKDVLALTKESLATPGKIKDNPELQQARESIKDKVGEMSSAVKWQQDNVKRAQGGVNTHGTGRHGAQTGLERQAQRLSSDVTPDQTSNQGGTSRTIGTWRTHKFEVTKTPDGKQKLEVPTRVVEAVIGEVNKLMATRTTSMFLNPVLEKEAVEKALAIADQAKDWKQWSSNGTDWNHLTSLTIVVPPPKTAKGYGLSMEQSSGITKKSATAAAALVKDFDTGKIKTLDELFKKLEVQVKTDETGVGALLVPHAKVVLVRPNTASAWTVKTHYPTEDAQGWECDRDEPLTGKRVRGPGVPPAKVAGPYTT